VLARRCCSAVHNNTGQHPRSTKFPVKKAPKISESIYWHPIDTIYGVFALHIVVATRVGRSILCKCLRTRNLCLRRRRYQGTVGNVEEWDCRLGGYVYETKECILPVRQRRPERSVLSVPKLLSFVYVKKCICPLGVPSTNIDPIVVSYCSLSHRLQFLSWCRCLPSHWLLVMRQGEL
jgi:hypothetical protein